MNREKLYINVYAENRAFGGREEGGWWYTYGWPAEGQRELGGGRTFFNRDNAYQHCAKLNDALDAMNRARGSAGNLGSVLCSYALSAAVEPHPPRAYPEQRPHYE